MGNPSLCVEAYTIKEYTLAFSLHGAAKKPKRDRSACTSHHPVLQLRLRAFIVGGSAYHRFGMSTLMVVGC